MTIRNLHERQIAFTIQDQLPVSGNQDIKVELLGRPAPSRRDLGDRRGVLAWDDRLNPEEEKAIESGYRITWPGCKVDHVWAVSSCCLLAGCLGDARRLVGCMARQVRALVHIVHRSRVGSRTWMSWEAWARWWSGLGASSPVHWLTLSTAVAFLGLIAVLLVQTRSSARKRQELAQLTGGVAPKAVEIDPHAALEGISCLRSTVCSRASRCAFSCSQR